MVETPKRVAPYTSLTLLIVLVIAYGSLYPFAFRYRPGSPLRVLADSYHQHDSPGDFLANILLYFPLGFIGVSAMRRRSILLQAASVTFAGTVLSASMELAQYYVPGRESSLADICSNTIGSFIGAGAGILLSHRLRLSPFQPFRGHPSGVLILGSWLGYRLFPYVPAIDLHKYWHAVRPLLEKPGPAPLDVYQHTVSWLVTAAVLDEVCPAAWKKIALPLCISLVLCARIVILDAFLSPAEVAGAGVAALCWLAFLSRMTVRMHVTFSLLATSVILGMLKPFRFTATARLFTWVPFYSFLHGSIFINSQSFLEKTFLYGGLVWLAMRSGLSWRTAVLACGGLVFALKLAQVYIPGRSAEISDVMILLIVAAAIQLLEHGRHDATVKLPQSA